MTRNQEDLHLCEQVIERVNEFTYLGSVIDREGGTDQDVQDKIKKARRAFGMLSRVWASRIYSINVKIRIFNTNVKSILFYGCETWKVTQTIVSQLQVFMNRCLRRLLRVFWPNTITNEELWRVTKQEPVCIQIRKRKWGWLGHTLRRPANDIARGALDWNPQGTRRRGRPRTTWRRTVLEEARSLGKSWGEIKQYARNRVRWRTLVEALCSGTE